MTLADEEVDVGELACTSASIDPGAFDSVTPTGKCKDVFFHETNRSRIGWAYEAAGGDNTLNEGQRNVTCFSVDGDLDTMGLQVAGINKPSGSVVEFVDVGRRVAFGKKVAYIENPHGNQTRLRRNNGMWHMDCRRVARSTRALTVSRNCFKGKAECGLVWAYETIRWEISGALCCGGRRNQSEGGEQTKRAEQGGGESSQVRTSAVPQLVAPVRQRQG